MEVSAPKAPYSVREEIAHTLTHGLGLLLSVVGLVVLVRTAWLRGDAWHIVSCTIFGVTLVMLYVASTLYHATSHTRMKRILRRFDHAAIFLLIAGSYTPFMLVSLRGGWGWTLLAFVWSLAALGIALEVAHPARARPLSLPLYLVMGWMIVLAIQPLARAVHPEGLTLLLLSGMAYTIGVVFYAWERLRFNHVIWHVFVLAGSACHFSCVLGYVIPPGV